MRTFLTSGIFALSIDTNLQELVGTVHEARSNQRLTLLESRQARLERDQKQLDAKIVGMSEELAQRPLKTDVISALAQQELAVEACASREALRQLAADVSACASSVSLIGLEGTVKASLDQITSLTTALADMKENTVSKALFQQRAKEIDTLHARMDGTISRDDCANLLASKLDRSEAQHIVQQQEQLQSACAGNEAQSKRLQDALASMNDKATDANGMGNQLRTRVERLNNMANDMHAKLDARHNEISSLTKVTLLHCSQAFMNALRAYTSFCGSSDMSVPIFYGVDHSNHIGRC